MCWLLWTLSSGKCDCVLDMQIYIDRQPYDKNIEAREKTALLYCERSFISFLLQNHSKTSTYL